MNEIFQANKNLRCRWLAVKHGSLHLYIMGTAQLNSSCYLGFTIIPTSAFEVWCI